MTISWAGPYVGNILAPLGIEVIKIEAQSPFDGFRTQRPYDHGMAPGQEHLVADNRFYEAGGLFNAVNKGKRGCVMTLATEEGREAFFELVRNSDALVANFSAHVLPQLGLSFDALAQVNPKIVLVRMPAYGTDGPYSAGVGYGSLIEAMGGLGQRQGYEHEQARISNIYFPDPIAGIHATFALMTGLWHAEQTGDGIEIDLSQQEATWLHNGEAIALASISGRDIGRMANREPGAAYCGFVQAADGWLAVVAVEPHTAVEVERVAASARQQTREQLEHQLVQCGARTQRCLDPWSAPGVSPVAEHLDVVDHPVTGPMRHLGSPFTLDGVRPQPTGHAPLFDQHTDHVLREVAQLDEAHIAQLRQAGHIGGELPTPASLGFVYD